MLLLTAMLVESCGATEVGPRGPTRERSQAGCRGPRR